MWIIKPILNLKWQTTGISFKAHSEDKTNYNSGSLFFFFQHEVCSRPDMSMKKGDWWRQFTHRDLLYLDRVFTPHRWVYTICVVSTEAEKWTHCFVLCSPEFLSSLKINSTRRAGESYWEHRGSLTYMTACRGRGAIIIIQCVYECVVQILTSHKHIKIGSEGQRGRGLHEKWEKERQKEKN